MRYLETTVIVNVFRLRNPISLSPYVLSSFIYQSRFTHRSRQMNDALEPVKCIGESRSDKK